MFASRLLRLHLNRRYRDYSQKPDLKIDVLDRVIYNCALQRKKSANYWQSVKEKNKNQKRVEIRHDVEPVSLQFLDGYSEHDKTVKPKLVEKLKDVPYSLPYSIVSKINSNNDGDQIEDNKDNEINYDCKLKYPSMIRFLLFYR